MLWMFFQGDNVRLVVACCLTRTHEHVGVSLRGHVRPVNECIQNPEREFALFLVGISIKLLGRTFIWKYLLKAGYII